MRRLITPAAIALVGLFLSVSSASAQPGRPGRVLPQRARSLPKMRVIGVSQQGGFARVVVSNPGTFSSPRRQMQLRIFRGGRQVGILRSFVPVIPGRGSRVVLIRTNIRLGLPGTVLAFQGTG